MKIKHPFSLSLGYLLALLLLISGCQTLSPAQDAATGDTPSPMPLPTLSAQAITPETVGRLTAVARWGDGRAFDVVGDPNGRYLGVITTIGLYVYDMADWTVVDFLPASEPIRSAAFTPDGRYLAVAGWQNNQVMIWEIGSDQPPVALAGNGEPVSQITFTATGQLLSNTVSQITGQDWQDVAAPASLIAAPANGRLGRMSWSAGGDFIAAPVQTQSGDEVIVQATDGRQPPPALRSQEGMTLENGRLSPDGTYYVAMATDRTLQRENALFIWQTAVPGVLAQIPVGQFTAETNWAIGADGRTLAAATPSGQIEIIQLDNGQTIAALPIAGAVTNPAQLKLLFNGQHLIVALPNGSLNIWNAAGTEPATFLADSRVPLTALQFLREKEQFATIDENGLVEIRQLPDGRLLHSLSAHAMGDITDVAFAPDGTAVAASLASGGVQIWGLDGRLQQTIEKPAGKVDSVAYSPDGRFLASGLGERIGPSAFDDTVNIWQMPEGALHRSIGGEKEDAPGCSFFRNSLAFSADGRWLASASHDFTVGLWQVSDGALVHNFPPHTDAVLDVALSPDGQYLASASEDATIRLWRLADFQLARELTGSVGGFWTISFSPDGRFLAGGDMLGRLYLWDVASGKMLRTFEGEKYKQSDLAFSADGRLLAAGANGNAIQLWQVDTGQIVGTLAGHSGVVQRLAFSRDGLSLVSSGQDNALRLWQLQP